MGCRYRNTFYSLGGDLYQIDIMDSLYSSTVSLFKTEKEGFRINYKALEQRLSPIFASDCNFSFYIENTTHESFIDEMINAPEERFGVNVYKNGNKYWTGVIVNDGIEKSDLYYPYKILLKFTDGLGRLSEKYYNAGGAETSVTPYSGRDTLIVHIRKCLSWGGLMQYYTANDTFIKLTCNFYEYRATDVSKNSIEYTNLDHKAFYSYDKDGNYEWKTCYAVLEDILQAFNLRIFMAGGIYVIMQVQEWQNTSARSWWYYKDGILKGYNSADTAFRINVSGLNRMDQGVYKYLKPIGEIKRILKYRNSNGEDDSLLPPQDNYNTATDFLNGLQCATHNESLSIYGTLHEWFDPTTGTGKNCIPVYKMKIHLITTLGTHYYLAIDENNQLIWTTSSSNYVKIKGHGFPDNLHTNLLTDLSLTTWPIPDVCTGTFQLYLDHFEDMYGSATMPGGTFTFKCEEFGVVLEGTVNPLSGEDDYYIQGNLTSSFKHELKETVIGDGPNYYSIGRLMSFISSTWVNSAWWRLNIGGYANTMVLINLAMMQNLYGQLSAVEVFQGEFTGTTLTADKAILWGSKILAPMALTVNPEKDSFNGQWFNCIIPAF